VDRSRLFQGLMVLVVLVNVIALLPILDSPFVADDEWYYSSIKGAGQLGACRVTSYLRCIVLLGSSLEHRGVMGRLL
jgi:hypothetical protein